MANSVNLYAAELEEPETEVVTARLVNRASGQIIEVPVEYTSQTVEQEGNQVTVSSTAEFVLPIDEESGIQPRTSVTDGGVTTRITLNLSYTHTGTRYRLDQVSGKYEQLDKAFTISNRKVAFISQEDYNGEPTIYNVSSNTFSYPGQKVWIETNGRWSYWIHGTAKCTISRGGSSWDLLCQETVIAQNPDTSSLL